MLSHLPLGEELLEVDHEMEACPLGHQRIDCLQEEAGNLENVSEE